MDRAYHITGRILVFVILLFVAGFIAVQLPAVQSFIASKVVDSLSESINGKIKVGSIRIDTNGLIHLKDITITDDEPYFEENPYGWEPEDTVIHFDRITAKFNIKSLFPNNILSLKKVSIDGATINLITEKAKDRYINQNINRILMRPLPGESAKKGRDVIEIETVEINGLNFSLKNYVRRKPVFNSMIDWGDFAISGSLKVKDLHFKKGIMSGHILSLHAKERGGFEIFNLQADARVGQGKAIVKHISLIDRDSRFKLDLLRLDYANPMAFQNFNDKVKLLIKPGNSLISTRTLKYFFKLDSASNLLVELQGGTISGYVNDLFLKSVRLVEKNSNTPLLLDGEIAGLPGVENLSLDLIAESSFITTNGVSSIVRSSAPNSSFSVSSYAKGKKLSLKADAKGRIIDLGLNITIGGEAGNAEAKLRIKENRSSESVSLNGDIDLQEFDLGAVLQKNLLGAIKAKASFRSDLSENGMMAYIDSLTIDHFGFKGYNYRNISANGTFDGNSLEGRLECNDPNADIDFMGKVVLKHNGEYLPNQYKLDIRNFNLHATNLDPRGEVSQAKGTLVVNYESNSLLNINGEAELKSLTLTNDRGIHKIGDIKLVSDVVDGESELRLTSSFADITCSANVFPSNLLDELKYIVYQEELPVLYERKSDENSEYTEAVIGVKVKNLNNLLDFVYPDLKVASGTTLEMNSNKRGDMNLLFDSKCVELKDKVFKDINLSLDNLSDKINSTLSTGSINIKGFEAINNHISVSLGDNRLDLGIFFQDKIKENSFGEIHFNTVFEKDKNDSLLLRIMPQESFMSVEGNEWKIDQSEILVNSHFISVDNFRLHSDKQALRINGTLSDSPTDTLEFSVDSLYLSLLKQLSNDKLDITGLANGSALVFSREADFPVGLANIDIKSLTFKGGELGDFLVSSAVDKKSNTIEFNLLNTVGHRHAISLNGSCNPKKNEISATAILDSLDMAIAHEILPDALSASSGYISGDINVSGKTDRLSIVMPALKFNDFGITPTANNVHYTINGLMSMNDTGINLNSLSINDDKSGTAVISGSIKHNFLKNLNFDINANIKNLNLLNKEEGDEGVYGILYASGNASIKGPGNGLDIAANVTTSDKSQLHIPIASRRSHQESNILTFKKAGGSDLHPADSVEVIRNGKFRNTSIKCQIKATSDLTMYVEIDKDSDNTFTSNGNGTINVDLKPGKSKLSLFGDYVINSGSYHFKALGNLISKNFTINRGSSIKFGGDLMDTEFDISSTYTLKASLKSLVADSTSVAERRTVNCGIMISDKFINPHLSFSIDVPDLDPTTQSRLESALNTEDKVQKQFIALLLTGSFIPDEMSGVRYNNSTILYSNLSNIMSNQINSIFKKLDIPIDLGLNYLRNEVGTNIFDVAVSTQLFNDRVRINGSLGNRQYSTRANGNMVGNIDIGIKLDKKGSLQLKLFSHSSDDYTKFLDNGQKNGIGFTFQKEIKNRSVSTGLKTIEIKPNGKTVSDTLSNR